MKRIPLVLAMLAATAAVLADQGMWTTHNFPREAVRQKYNVNLDDTWLQKLQRSVVRLETGCTGSFVSPEGPDPDQPPLRTVVPRRELDGRARSRGQWLRLAGSRRGDQVPGRSDLGADGHGGRTPAVTKAAAAAARLTPRASETRR